MDVGAGDARLFFAPKILDVVEDAALVLLGGRQSRRRRRGRRRRGELRLEARFGSLTAREQSAGARRDRRDLGGALPSRRRARRGLDAERRRRDARARRIERRADCIKRPRVATTSKAVCKDITPAK